MTDTKHFVAQFSLAELLTATGGQLLGNSNHTESFTLSTDSRTLQPGQWFIPIVGERFDGHQFVEQAYAQNVTGVLINQSQADENPQWKEYPNCVVVPDTTQAYLDLASCHRQRCNAKIVAITGSSGKTTVKEMLVAAFGPVVKTQATQKNFNNEIGVSQTLLGLHPDTEMMIVEMGMRGLNQIRPLSLSAKPDVAVVINVGPAHIGLLGSLENIALAKCEIYEGLNPETGIGVYNADDVLLSEQAHRSFSGELSGFSIKEICEKQMLAGGGVQFNIEGFDVQLASGSEHITANALSVFKVAQALAVTMDFDPAEAMVGLKHFEPAQGRGDKQPLEGLDNVFVINDAYNANPQSMKAALKAVLSSDSSSNERLVLILGGMKELGEHSAPYHQELAEWLAGQSNLSGKVPLIVAVGEEMDIFHQAFQKACPLPCQYLQQADALPTQLQALLNEQGILLENLTIFLKGSRGYHLESVIDALAKIGQTV